MERKNVMMDAETWAAAQYLARLNDHDSASAAIRQAVKEQARRKGWKPDRRTPTTPPAAAAEDRGGET